MLCLARFQGGGGGGVVLPYKGKMGMCRWLGSHFHDWIDYNGVVFLIELLEWGRTISGFRDKEILVSMDLKIGRSAVKKKMVRSVVLKFNSRLTLKSVLEI